MRVQLRNEVQDALVRLAIAERRDARHQAEYLVEEGLRRRGLLRSLSDVTSDPAPSRVRSATGTPR